MQGIRIIDLTSVLSGPYCTWLLAAMGADVIKVESPAGDIARGTPPFADGVSLYFASVNRNKRSVVLDLKTPAGRTALHKLVESADVFVENMRPGVRDRLGCSESELQSINPKLIQASISGFGQSGSLADRPAYDIVVQAMSGMMGINGPLGGPPTRVGFSVGDVAAALFAALGILQRLYERDVSANQPDHTLDISMLACQWACLENAFARNLNAGIEPGPIGSRHPSMTPFETYPTADRDIVIALGSEKDWTRFCDAIGLGELARDARFEKDTARLENRDAMNDILNRHLSSRPAAYWVEILLTANIPSSVIETVGSSARGDYAAEYQPFSRVNTDSGAEQQFVRSPLAGRGQTESAAPLLGQHTSQVLGELDLDPDVLAAVLG